RRSRWSQWTWDTSTASTAPRSAGAAVDRRRWKMRRRRSGSVRRRTPSSSTMTVLWPSQVSVQAGLTPPREHGPDRPRQRLRQEVEQRGEVREEKDDQDPDHVREGGEVVTPEDVEEGIDPETDQRHDEHHDPEHLPKGRQREHVHLLRQLDDSLPPYESDDHP